MLNFNFGENCKDSLKEKNFVLCRLKKWSFFKNHILGQESFGSKDNLKQQRWHSMMQILRLCNIGHNFHTEKNMSSLKTSMIFETRKKLIFWYFYNNSSVSFPNELKFFLNIHQYLLIIILLKNFWWSVSRNFSEGVFWRKFFILDT